MSRTPDRRRAKDGFELLFDGKALGKFILPADQVTVWRVVNGVIRTNFNTTIAKSLALGSGTRLQVRADVFNALNHKNYNGHRSLNFRFHVPTADALREIMVRAGVSTEVEPEAVISGATPTK